jgi:hypothetical protein
MLWKAFLHSLSVNVAILELETTWVRQAIEIRLKDTKDTTLEYAMMVRVEKGLLNSSAADDGSESGSAAATGLRGGRKHIARKCGSLDSIKKVASSS